MTQPPTDISELRARYAREVETRERSIPDADARIEAAQAAERNARAALIVGDGTAADVAKALHETEVAIEARRILREEIEGLRERLEEVCAKLTVEQRVHALEREVTPAAVEFAKLLHRVEECTAELGKVLQGAITAHQRACRAWPHADENQRPQAISLSTAGFSSHGHNELIAHLWALLCRETGEALHYHQLPPTAPFRSTGAEFLAGAKQNGTANLSEAIARQWIGLLEGIAERPDLAESVRAAIDGKAPAARSNKRAA